ncbi:MAG: tetratricopeptide repeat protein [Gemmataceae bacterium]|nr:tetratricopeptide repeat protein [Gemmataceae bacterium]
MEPKSIDRIFCDAAQIASPAERDKYLDQACAGDAALRQKIAQLLEIRGQAGDFLESPPPGLGATAAAASVGECPGTVIGPYKLLQQIGEGGMGVVWMAEQSEPVKRKVALKIIKPGMDSKQVIARFEAERQALALMDHVNIARVFDGGTTGASVEASARRDDAAQPRRADAAPLAVGRPYFVMELVHGIPITTYCDDNHLTPRERLELFVPVCQAIQHAHQKGVIHRDIKPSNVMVTLYDGKPVPKVIDFGVAKATEQKLTERTLFTQYGTMIGTLEYMSPEQAEMSALGVDTRSDIYSLGVLLYELLTGTTPFDKERLRTAAYDEIRRIIREEEPPRPSIRCSTLGQAAATVSANRKSDPSRLSQQCRGELDWIVMKALEKDRNRRYETASGLARDVERYLADEPVQACPPSSWYRFRKFARRHKAGVASAAMALCFIVLLGVGAGWFMLDRAARYADTAGRVDSTLQEAARLRDQKSWSEARAAVQRADLVLGSGTGYAGLRQRLRDLVSDLDMVDRLERVRDVQDVVKGEQWDYAIADQPYEATFRDYGIDVLTLDAAVAAQRVQSAAISEQLVAALDAWISVIPRENADQRKQVRAVVDLADPDPWRTRFRDPSVLRNRSALEELASRPEVSDLPPCSVVLLGRALVAAGAAPKAVEILTAAQRRQPADFWLNQQLASILCWHIYPSRNEEATGYCRAALAIRPNSAGMHAGLGSCLLRPGREDEAIALYRRAMELQPDYTHPYHSIGRALAMKGALKEAIDSYHKFLLGKPSPWYAAYGHYDLAEAYKSMDEPDKAIVNYWTALEFNPKHVGAKNALSNATRNRKSRDKVIDFFSKFVQANPHNAPARWYLGNALWFQGNADQSLGHFEKAVQHDPNEKEYYYSLGNNQRRLNQLDEAILSYQKAIDLNLKSAWMYHELGLALRGKDRLGEAIKSWKKAVEIDANFSRVHTNLGWLLATAADPKLRDAKAAVFHAQKAVDLAPKEANYRSNLGVALLRVGHCKAAVETLEKADQMWSGGDQQHRFFLAMAYWQVGDKDKARQAYEQGVQWMDKHDPNREELRRFRVEAEELMKKEISH